MLNRNTPTSKKQRKTLRVVACIQARMGSTRLKKKALLKISGRTIIENILRRLKTSQEINDIVLATSLNKNNDVLVDHTKDIGLKYYRGREKDVISRLYETAKKFKADALVKITADCPLVDPKLVDRMVKKYRQDYRNFDFFTNVFPPTFPDGLDIDVLPFPTLKKLNTELKNSLDREYFGCYILKNPQKFKIYNLKSPINLSSFRWTVDYIEDFIFVKKIFQALDKKNKIFTTPDILDFLKKNPEIIEINIRRVDNCIVQGIRGGVYHSMVEKLNKSKKYE